MIRKYILSFAVLFCALALIGDVRKITILQTTDVHGNFGELNNPASLGNWLKLSSLIKKEVRSSGGQDNVLLIDCGDTIQGSFSSSLSKGETAITMINYLNYDAWILGNHDFDFGINRLLDISNTVKADIFAGNLKLNNSDFTFRAWKVYRKNGLKIAVLGLTYPELHNYLWKSRKDFYVFSIEKSINKFMPDIIKENPDMIILAVHYGDIQDDKNMENDLNKIAARHPEINLILGGHFHTDEPGRIIGSKVWYGSAGRHAEKLFRADVEIDTEKHKINYIRSILIPVIQSTPIDDDARKVSVFGLEKAKAEAQEQIGKTDTPITSAPENNSLTSEGGDLLGRATAAAAGTELAIIGPPSKEELHLNITALNLFLFIPYEDSISTLDLKYDEVCDIISEQVRKRSLKNFQQPFGFYVEVDKQGNIKGDIKFANGTVWQDKSQRYTIVFSSYVLGGAGGKFSTLKKIAENPASRVNNNDILLRDAVKEYISQNSPLKIKNTQWIKFAK